MYAPRPGHEHVVCSGATCARCIFHAHLPAQSVDVNVGVYEDAYRREKAHVPANNAALVWQLDFVPDGTNSNNNNGVGAAVCTHALTCDSERLILRTRQYATAIRGRIRGGSGALVDVLLLTNLDDCVEQRTAAARATRFNAYIKRERSREVAGGGGSRPEIHARQRRCWHLAALRMHVTQRDFANAIRKVDQILRMDEGDGDGDDDTSAVGLAHDHCADLRLPVFEASCTVELLMTLWSCMIEKVRLHPHAAALGWMLLACRFRPCTFRLGARMRDLCARITFDLCAYAQCDRFQHTSALVGLAPGTSASGASSSSATSPFLRAVKRQTGGHAGGATASAAASALTMSTTAPDAGDALGAYEWDALKLLASRPNAAHEAALLASFWVRLLYVPPASGVGSTYRRAYRAWYAQFAGTSAAASSSTAAQLAFEWSDVVSQRAHHITKVVASASVQVANILALARGATGATQNAGIRAWPVRVFALDQMQYTPLHLLMQTRFFAHLATQLKLHHTAELFGLNAALASPSSLGHTVLDALLAHMHDADASSSSSSSSSTPTTPTPSRGGTKRKARGGGGAAAAGGTDRDVLRRLGHAPDVSSTRRRGTDQLAHELNAVYAQMMAHLRNQTYASRSVDELLRALVRNYWNEKNTRAAYRRVSNQAVSADDAQIQLNEGLIAHAESTLRSDAARAMFAYLRACVRADALGEYERTDAALLHLLRCEVPSDSATQSPFETLVQHVHREFETVARATATASESSGSSSVVVVVPAPAPAIPDHLISPLTPHASSTSSSSSSALDWSHARSVDYTRVFLQHLAYARAYPNVEAMYAGNEPNEHERAQIRRFLVDQRHASAADFTKPKKYAVRYSAAFAEHSVAYFHLRTAYSATGTTWVWNADRVYTPKAQKKRTTKKKTNRGDDVMDDDDDDDEDEEEEEEEDMDDDADDDDDDANAANGSARRAASASASAARVEGVIPARAPSASENRQYEQYADAHPHATPTERQAMREYIASAQRNPYADFDVSHWAELRARTLCDAAPASLHAHHKASPWQHMLHGTFTLEWVCRIGKCTGELPDAGRCLHTMFDADAPPCVAAHLPRGGFFATTVRDVCDAAPSGAGLVGLRASLGPVWLTTLYARVLETLARDTHRWQRVIVVARDQAPQEARDSTRIWRTRPLPPTQFVYVRTHNGREFVVSQTHVIAASSAAASSASASSSSAAYMLSVDARTTFAVRHLLAHTRANDPVEFADVCRRLVGTHSKDSAARVRSIRMSRAWNTLDATSIGGTLGAALLGANARVCLEWAERNAAYGALVPTDAAAAAAAGSARLANDRFRAPMLDMHLLHQLNDAVSRILEGDANDVGVGVGVDANDRAYDATHLLYRRWYAMLSELLAQHLHNGTTAASSSVSGSGSTRRDTRERVACVRFSRMPLTYRGRLAGSVDVREAHALLLCAQAGLFVWDATQNVFYLASTCDTEHLALLVRDWSATHADRLLASASASASSRATHAATRPSIVCPHDAFRAHTERVFASCAPNSIEYFCALNGLAYVYDRLVDVVGGVGGGDTPTPTDSLRPLRWSLLHADARETRFFTWNAFRITEKAVASTGARAPDSTHGTWFATGGTTPAKRVDDMFRDASLSEDVLRVRVRTMAVMWTMSLFRFGDAACLVRPTADVATTTTASVNECRAGVDTGATFQWRWAPVLPDAYVRGAMRLVRSCMQLAWSPTAFAVAAAMRTPLRVPLALSVTSSSSVPSPPSEDAYYRAWCREWSDFHAGNTDGAAAAVAMAASYTFPTWERVRHLLHTSRDHGVGVLLATSLACANVQTWIDLVVAMVVLQPRTPAHSSYAMLAVVDAADVCYQACLHAHEYWTSRAPFIALGRSASVSASASASAGAAAAAPGARIVFASPAHMSAREWHQLARGRFACLVVLDNMAAAPKLSPGRARAVAATDTTAATAADTHAASSEPIPPLPATSARSAASPASAAASRVLQLFYPRLARLVIDACVWFVQPRAASSRDIMHHAMWHLAASTTRRARDWSAPDLSAHACFAARLHVPDANLDALLARTVRAHHIHTRASAFETRWIEWVRACAASDAFPREFRDAWTSRFADHVRVSFLHLAFAEPRDPLTRLMRRFLDDDAATTSTASVFTHEQRAYLRVLMHHGMTVDARNRTDTDDEMYIGPPAPPLGSVTETGARFVAYPTAPHAIEPVSTRLAAVVRLVSALHTPLTDATTRASPPLPAVAVSASSELATLQELVSPHVPFASLPPLDRTDLLRALPHETCDTDFMHAFVYACALAYVDDARVTQLNEWLRAQLAYLAHDARAAATVSLAAGAGAAASRGGSAVAAGGDYDFMVIDDGSTVGDGGAPNREVEEEKEQARSGDEQGNNDDDDDDDDDDATHAWPRDASLGMPRVWTLMRGGLVGVSHAWFAERMRAIPLDDLDLLVHTHPAWLTDARASVSLVAARLMSHPEWNASLEARKRVSLGVAPSKQHTHLAAVYRALFKACPPLEVLPRAFRVGAELLARARAHLTHSHVPTEARALVGAPLPADDGHTLVVCEDAVEARIAYDALRLGVRPRVSCLVMTSPNGDAYGRVALADALVISSDRYGANMQAAIAELLASRPERPHAAAAVAAPWLHWCLPRMKEARLDTFLRYTRVVIVARANLAYAVARVPRIQSLVTVVASARHSLAIDLAPALQTLARKASPRTAHWYQIE